MQLAADNPHAYAVPPLYMGPAANPYDRVAGLCWVAHRLWLTFSARAERTLLTYLSDVVRPGDRLLEVGPAPGC